MPDVNLPGNSEDDNWLRGLAPEARSRFLYPGQRPPTDDHRTGVRLGVFGIAMQCTTCGTICIARHEPMLLTDNETGESVTVPGAWVGPSDDPHRHFFPFREAPPQFATSQAHDSEPSDAPKPRPAGISAEAVAKANAHRADAPSRQPDARRAERARAKRRISQDRVRLP